jgi:hypothetical protein
MSSRNVLEQVLTIVRNQLAHHDITWITGRDVHTFLVGRHLGAQIFRLEPRSNYEITFFVDLVGFAVICERGRLSGIRHSDGFRQVVQNISSDCAIGTAVHQLDRSTRVGQNVLGLLHLLTLYRQFERSLHIVGQLDTNVRLARD